MLGVKQLLGIRCLKPEKGQKQITPGTRLPSCRHQAGEKGQDVHSHLQGLTGFGNMTLGKLA